MSAPLCCVGCLAYGRRIVWCVGNVWLGHPDGCPVYEKRILSFGPQEQGVGPASL